MRGVRWRVFIENINDNKHTLFAIFFMKVMNFFNQETVLYVWHVESLELKQTVSERLENFCLH